jgi:hypothetical protein
MGAGYFMKIPPKKALSDYGMAQLTPAEEFWYRQLPLTAASRVLIFVGLVSRRPTLCDQRKHLVIFH